MTRVTANDGQAFAVLHGMLACGLASLSAAGCGGLADERRGEPVGMFEASGGSSRQEPPPGGACNPLIGNGCEVPAGCNSSSSPQCRPPTAGSSGETPRVPRCEENPLLPECGVTLPGDPPVPEPPPDPGPDPFLEGPDGAAMNILNVYCAQCHGPAELFPDGGLGGLDDIEDLSKLVRDGYITDCSAESSRIIQVMRSGSMPPVESGLPPVWAADLDLVVQAIEFGCTDSDKRCAGDPALPGCGVVLAERALERHCGECHGEWARQRADGLWEGMTSIDMTLLIENARVVPCQSEVSPLLVRARDGSMPVTQRRFGGPWSPRSDAVVTSFIDGLCPGPASPEDTSPEKIQQLRVEELLGTYCGECHGQRAVELGQVQGNLDDIESVDALIRAGGLVPCVSGSSPVIQALRDGSMPPAASLGPRPSAAEIQLIADFVDRPCAGP